VDLVSFKCDRKLNKPVQDVQYLILDDDDDDDDDGSRVMTRLFQGDTSLALVDVFSVNHTRRQAEMFLFCSIQTFWICVWYVTRRM
jgi:hypothetical protein